MILFCAGGEVDVGGVFSEAIVVGFVSDIGMDVGIIPENGRLEAFGAEAVDAIDAA